MTAEGPVPLAEVLARHEAADVAWVAATSAARLVQEERPDDLGVRSKSSAADVVTVMDAAAERLITEVIATSRPDDALLGEEGGHDTGTSRYRWVVDPIDGTVNYLHRSPLFGVSVGLEEEDRPVVGVIARPALGDALVGIVGAGSWLVRRGLAEPLAAQAPPRLDGMIVGANLSYDAATRGRQAARLAALAPVVRDIRLFGAATYDLTELACGTIHGYLGENLSPWDVSAGTAILRAAGYEVITHHRPGSTITVACHPDRTDTLVRALDEATDRAGSQG